MQFSFVYKFADDKVATVVIQRTVEMCELVMFQAASSYLTLIFDVLIQVIILVGEVLNAVAV